MLVPVKSVLLLIPLALAGCVAAQDSVVATTAGPLIVRFDPDMPRFAGDPSGVDPFPEFGALVVTASDGAALPLSAEPAARQAIAAYCEGQGRGGVVRDLSYRGMEDGSSTWSAAPCASA